ADPSGVGEVRSVRVDYRRKPTSTIVWIGNGTDFIESSAFKFTPGGRLRAGLIGRINEPAERPITGRGDVNVEKAAPVCSASYGYTGITGLPKRSMNGSPVAETNRTISNRATLLDNSIDSAASGAGVGLAVDDSTNGSATTRDALSVSHELAVRRRIR